MWGFPCHCPAAAGSSVGGRRRGEAGEEGRKGGREG